MRHFLFSAAVLALAAGLMSEGEARAASTLRIIEPVAVGATLAGLAKSNAGQRAEIDAIAQLIAARGSAEIEVKTRIAFAPESLLGPSELTVQRLEIARAANALRRDVAAAAAFQSFADRPYVRLRIGATGLKQLLASKDVARVARADRSNWMRDYVELKTATVAQRRAPAAPAGEVAAAPRIAGGTVAEPGVHPFQVALLNRSDSNNFSAQFCSGTLVAERYVVTAAHCSFATPGDVQVLVGTQDLDGTGSRRTVANIAVHPSYNRDNLDYDVAVWELSSHGVVSYAGPYAALADTQPTTTGMPLRATGWGRTSLGGPRPVSLRVADVPYVPSSGGKCQAEDVTGQMICAGQENKGSCGDEDSGGPLTMNKGAGYNTLVGIFSFRNGCGEPGSPGVYTNVADTDIRSFVQQNVKVGMRSYIEGAEGGAVVFLAGNNILTACGNRYCDRYFDLGQVITMKAQVDLGTAFAGWSGSGCSGTKPCTVKMDVKKVVTATFKKGATFRINYTKAGTAAGSVEYAPFYRAYFGQQPLCKRNCEMKFNKGDRVTITAKPAAGKAFGGWSGDCKGQKNPCRLTMNANKKVTATFR